MTERQEDRARLFVPDGTHPGAWKSPDDVIRQERTRKQRELRAYLYSGWEITGWGSAPSGHIFGGRTGFYLEGPREGGFGVKAMSARLTSGLHWNAPVEAQVGEEASS